MQRNNAKNLALHSHKTCSHFTLTPCKHCNQKKCKWIMKMQEGELNSLKFFIGGRQGAKPWSNSHQLLLHPFRGVFLNPSLLLHSREFEFFDIGNNPYKNQVCLMWAILHIMFNFNPLTTCMVVMNPNHLSFGFILMWGSQENIGMFIWDNMINFLSLPLYGDWFLSWGFLLESLWHFPSV